MHHMEVVYASCGGGLRIIRRGSMRHLNARLQVNAHPTPTSSFDAMGAHPRLLPSHVQVHPGVLCNRNE